MESKNELRSGEKWMRNKEDKGNGGKNIVVECWDGEVSDSGVVPCRKGLTFDQISFKLTLR